MYNTSYIDIKRPLAIFTKQDKAVMCGAVALNGNYPPQS